MKSIKKFSAMTATDQPITESAKVSQEAVEELIKKIGFDSIEELKKEKDLLSKLESLAKSSAKKMTSLKMALKKIELRILRVK